MAHENSKPATDGGPAFPVQDASTWQGHGLSIRDYLAARAMQALVASNEAKHVSKQAAADVLAIRVCDGGRNGFRQGWRLTDFHRAQQTREPNQQESDMGCDIHAYKEKFVGGKWVTADTWVAYNYGDDDKGIEVPYEQRFTNRNYNLFGLLAKGVRREFDFSFEARGRPLSASPEVAAQSSGWDGDGHGHSYLYLHELRELRDWLNANTMPVSGMMAADQYGRLRASIDSGAPDWMLLYPFCQGTTDRTYVEFALDVPASFMVGDGLDEIIASFEGIDGENHRLVFWFDN